MDSYVVEMRPASQEWAPSFRRKKRWKQPKIHDTSPDTEKHCHNTTCHWQYAIQTMPGAQCKVESQNNWIDHLPSPFKGIVLAKSSCTNSLFTLSCRLWKNFSPTADMPTLRKHYNTAKGNTPGSFIGANALHAIRSCVLLQPSTGTMADGHCWQLVLV